MELEGIDQGSSYPTLFFRDDQVLDVTNFFGNAVLQGSYDHDHQSFIDLYGVIPLPSDSSSTNSTTSTRSPVSPPDTASVENGAMHDNIGTVPGKGDRRKLQNRLSQRTYRERQRQLADRLNAEIVRVQTLNGQLASRVKSLESKVAGLQREMLLHFEVSHGFGLSAVPWSSSGGGQYNLDAFLQAVRTPNGQPGEGSSAAA